MADFLALQKALASALICLLAGCSMGESHSFEGWDVHVSKHNSSTLLIEASSMTLRQFMIGDEFSNARKYIEIIDSDGNINGSSSFAAGYASTISYRVHFPIGWSPKNPYGILSDSFGVVPASFLFPRVEGEEMVYRLNFKNVGMDVHNSDLGDATEYVVSEEDLLETYFIFGPFKKECSFNAGNATFTVVSTEKRINASVCGNIKKIVSYYASEFGGPKAVSSFEIGFFPARSYSSLRSGIYYPEIDYEWLAHELLHLWEPKEKCRGSKLMGEMLASYMQVHAQYEAGIISLDEESMIFGEKMAQLSSLPTEYLALDDEGLIELRKNDASAYSALIYSKGALIGKRMDEEGMSPKDIIKLHIEGNCTVLSSFVQEHEKKIEEGILQQELS